MNIVLEPQAGGTIPCKADTTTSMFGVGRSMFDVPSGKMANPVGVVSCAVEKHDSLSREATNGGGLGRGLVSFPTF